MNVTNEDLQAISLQLGNLQMQVVILEREKRDLMAALKATTDRLEQLGNPDGLHFDKVTQKVLNG